jgi:hypothetical protein
MVTDVTSEAEHPRSRCLEAFFCFYLGIIHLGAHARRGSVVKMYYQHYVLEEECQKDQHRTMKSMESHASLEKLSRCHIAC